MIISADALTLETHNGTLFARLGSPEFFVSRPVGQPLMHFNTCNENGSSQVWGFGFYVAASPVSKQVPQA